MQTLNLCNLDKSDVKYEIFKFPDGEIQIKIISELNHKEDLLKVVARIKSADDLFILMQLNDILTRHEMQWDLRIVYLMSARMDRVMDFNRPYSLKIVHNILKSFSCIDIEILDCHSEKFPDIMYESFFNKLETEVDYGSTIVFPDAGAKSRYLFYFNYDIGVITFNKKRDLDTGKIIEFEIDEMYDIHPEKFVFVDDLCDGGGTFLGELEVLKKEYPKATFELMVCHAVNPIGLLKVCDAFDKVTISNSYFNYASNDKLNVIEVC